MDKQVLVDIGNTSITVAQYDEGVVMDVHTIPISEYEKLSSLFKGVNQVVLSSVVPEIDYKLREWGAPLHFVDVHNIPDLRVHLTIPDDVGADRLVNALAAYHQFHRDVVIVDSGTALTFCVVTKEGCYEGGLIFPGMKMASTALHQQTAKIPLIWVDKEEGIIGKNTEEAVKMGLYHGYNMMINGLIQQYRNQLPNLLVIGTGTGLEVLKESLDLDDWDPMLQLKGLAICADVLNKEH